MTSPAPGWYPDPGGAAPYRWWNGQTWTTATSDGTTPASEQAAAAQPAAPVTPTTPQATPGYDPMGQPTYGGAAASTPQFGAADPNAGSMSSGSTAYGTKSPFDSSGSAYSQVLQTQAGQNNTLWHKNQAAFGTFILLAASVLMVLAFTSPLIIFTPVAAAGAANQSRNRGEQLAPLAMGAAAIAIVIGVVSITRFF